MEWIKNLPNDVFQRLFCCLSIKEDIPILVNARWSFMRDNPKYKGFTKEDALISVLEILDSNSCYFDLTSDEYREYSKED